MNRTLWRLIKIAVFDKWWMILAAFLGFLTIGSAIGLLMTSAYIIAKAALHPSIAELQISIVGVRFFGITRGVFRYFERLISHEVTFRLLARIRAWFYRSIEPLVPSRLMSYRSSDLLARMMGDIENLENIYLRVLAPPLVAFLVSVLLFFLFGNFSWYCATILLTGLIIAGIGIPLLTSIMSKGLGKKIVGLQSDLKSYAVDGIQGMADLLVFGQLENHFSRYYELNEKLVTTQRKMKRIAAMNDSLIGLIMNITVAAVLIELIPRITGGFLDGVYLSVLVIGVMAAFEAVNPLPQAAQDLEKSIESAERLFEFEDMKKIQPSFPVTKKISGQADIKFENIHFSYEPEDPPVLKNINLYVPGGSKLAIVGPSGSGKSTLVKLLLRLWDNKQGSIYIGEDEITAFSTYQITDKVAVVPQRSHLFSMTVKDNLQLANPTAGDSEINYILSLVGLDERISKMPQGVDSWIGEQGLKLSGGERQLLAVARGLVKEAPVLILDEPTANLDVISERQLLRSIFGYADKKTLILITHRLVELENMDEIIVLAGGEIVERGSHAELIQKQGYYFKMLQLQKDLLA